MNRKKFISLIPARGGSKGIPKKNIKKLYNKPLIAYSIEQSLNSKIICETYVSTEDNSIKEISSQYGAKVIERPFVLATDTASTESVMIHAAEYLNYDFDYMVLLQPTSPLRFSWQIDEAIELLLDNSADSLLSVCENNSFLWDPRGYPINYDFKNRPRRQDKIWELRENGSIYITKKEILLKEKNRLGGKIVFYKMPEWMSFEIDNFFDFQLIEWIIKTKFIKENKNLKKLIKKIKLFICDVDGVFTNGSVYLDSNGNEILKFSRIDGKGIELLKEKGIPIAIISSENSEIIKLRMRKLKINDIFVGEKEKFKIYTYLKEKYSLKDEEICYLGDDIQDLELCLCISSQRW